MTKRIMKGYCMYYDNYYPSMPEDLYSYPAAGSELQPDGLQMDESISDDLQTDELQPDDLQSDMDYSEDWVNSQEYDPIIPYTDSPEDEQVFGAPMSGRTAQSMQDQPMQAQPMQAQPAMFRPDRPNPSVRPDRPNPPERPDRPNPPRPVPPRPVPPIVNPDWSWNWGFILPGTVFPVSVARVRFYNAAIRGPIQIYINNRLVVSNLGFLDFTRFYNVAPGRYRITIYSDNNMRTPIVDTWMSFQRNTSTTVTLAGSGSNFWLQTTEQ